MPTVRCPDCGAFIELSPGVATGTLIECPNCAGQALRVLEEGGCWSVTLAHRVSCPDCEKVMTLPETAKIGDTVSCCGRTYTLTFEFGAFAAERNAG